MVVKKAKAQTRLKAAFMQPAEKHGLKLHLAFSQEFVSSNR